MKLLFVCTHNRCRSILAEAVANRYGQPSIVAASAGSQPAGQVHPLTLAYLAERGFDTAGLHSKSWDELKDFHPDAVITLCDDASGEPCPVWMGHTARVHWGLRDPSRTSGSDQAIEKAFFATIDTLQKRIEYLMLYHPDTLHRQALVATLEEAEKRFGAP